MSINTIKQTSDTTTIKTNTQNNTDRNDIKKDFYEFFNYNDLSAWNNNQDLMDKYLYAAKQSDYHSPDGVIKSDGYLSKKEFEIFKGYLKNEDLSNFPNNIISDKEQQMFKDDLIIKDTLEASSVITTKNKKALKNINNISIAGVTLAGSSILGMITASALGGTTATGLAGALTGLTVLGAAGGLAIAGIGLAIFLGYNKHLKNKANEAAETNKSKEIIN